MGTVDVIDTQQLQYITDDLGSNDSKVQVQTSPLPGSAASASVLDLDGNLGPSAMSRQISNQSRQSSISSLRSSGSASSLSRSSSAFRTL